MEAATQDFSRETVGNIAKWGVYNMSVDLLGVLKWVAVIVLTGFFAQFGRMIAQYIVRKVREKRGKDDVAGSSDTRGDSIDPVGEIEKQRLKLEKKRLKIEKKKMKKNDDV